MKIGVDYSSVSVNKTGIGSFAYNLLQAMQAQPSDFEWNLFSPKNRQLNTPKRMYWEAIDLPSRVQKSKCDILYSPGFSPPPTGRFKKLVTVHDLIGLIYPANVGWASRCYWSWWLPANLKKADRLVASSQSTKSDIVRLLKIPDTNIEVVPLAVHADFKKLASLDKAENIKRKFGLNRNYVICVGSLEPRKNHLALLKAFDALNQKKAADFDLVVIGKPAGAEFQINQFIKERNLQNCVHLLGYVEQEELNYLYNSSMAYAMISLYEGFGLPALEAMSCGKTGIVSNRSSLPEVVGDTAIQVDPESQGEIEEALIFISKNESERNRLADRAHMRSRLFSIDTTALRMMSVLHDL